MRFRGFGVLGFGVASDSGCLQGLLGGFGRSVLKFRLWGTPSSVYALCSLVLAVDRCFLILFGSRWFGI